MAMQVQVQDVGELRSYATQLAGLRQELISASSQLSRLAGDMRDVAGNMKSVTERQSSNWSDPQYDQLRGDVMPVAESVDGTAEAMQDTSALINSKMDAVQDSLDYIVALIRKLEEV